MCECSQFFFCRRKKNKNQMFSIRKSLKCDDCVYKTTSMFNSSFSVSPTHIYYSLTQRKRARMTQRSMPNHHLIAVDQMENRKISVFENDDNDDAIDRCSQFTHCHNPIEHNNTAYTRISLYRCRPFSTSIFTVCLVHRIGSPMPSHSMDILLFVLDVVQ